MRLVFAGTPEPAIPSLRALAASEHEVVAVVTRPDAQAGRGRKIVESPVAQVAAELGIPCLKPASAKDPEFHQQLRELEPDACPVVAYGALIPAEALEIPKHGWINLHFSLLPAWRGAAPVQHSIIAGDEITGASTFRIEEGLDTGPVFGVVTQSISSTDTAGTLLETLADSGSTLLVKTMDGLADGSLVPVPQPADGVSLAPKISPADAQIPFTDPAFAVDRRIRGCSPFPGAWSTLEGKRVKVGPVTLADPARLDQLDIGSLEPGVLHPTKKQVFVGTGNGIVVLDKVKPEGKGEMAAADWARGQRIEPGARFEWV
ncbi:MAG: methionyl-tRNA formyltransferase [Candidatus Nanopelagicales bacterium]